MSSERRQWHRKLPVAGGARVPAGPHAARAEPACLERQQLALTCATRPASLCLFFKLAH